MEGAVGLFLPESGAEAVTAGVAMQTEGAGVVGDGVPVRIDQDWGLGDLLRISWTMVSMVGSRNEIDALLEESVHGCRRRQSYARNLP